MNSLLSLIKKVKQRVSPKRFSLNEAHDYWRNTRDSKNKARLYVEKKCLVRTDKLVSLFESTEIPRASSILEFGCNAGRNLAGLFDAGFQDLAGVEISSNAIDTLRSEYPSLDGIEVHHGLIEDFLKAAPKEVDVSFSMAVFLHIHPDSDWIFDAIAKITRKYIITVEHESAADSSINRIWNRNYREVFEGKGFVQIQAEVLTERDFLPGYTARVFKRA